MEQEQLTEFKIQPGRLHAKESGCSFIWFKFNK